MKQSKLTGAKMKFKSIIKLSWHEWQQNNFNFKFLYNSMKGIRRWGSNNLNLYLQICSPQVPPKGYRMWLRVWPLHPVHVRLGGRSALKTATASTFTSWKPVPTVHQLIVSAPVSYTDAWLHFGFVNTFLFVFLCDERICDPVWTLLKCWSYTLDRPVIV